ncbi:hypothetical protein PDJAM_G00118210 [Pangasius djambal]|uniref:Uncharacterized protein n=1 Tax=Pangasius djambal TaxID=1691987 RepID=A0ACC5Z9X8_9TELE|nr:hypothetical protein [Pangasius djambal]
MDRTKENRQEYKELQRRVKREVSKAKQKAYDELYTRLDTREGQKDLYRLARQRDRDGKDVQQVRVIKDRDGSVLTSEESVQRRWKEYFEELMNEENEREKRVEGVTSVEQKVDKIRKDEVRKALKRMKSGKAVGPDDIPVEVWKCLGEAAVEFLTSLFNRVLESEKMTEEWRVSSLTEKIAALEVRIQTLERVSESESSVISVGESLDASGGVSNPPAPALEPSQRGEWVTTRRHNRKAKANAKARPREHHSSPLHVSNRFALLGEAPAEKPERALVIGDSILWHVKLARPLGAPAALVRCILGARVPT